MYKETVKITNKNIFFYLENRFEKLFINDSKLELSSLDSLNPIGETLVASCLVVSISVGSYFKSALYHYLYENYKLFGSKPINVLILIQAIIQHFTCLFMVIEANCKQQEICVKTKENHRKQDNDTILIFSEMFSDYEF